RLPAEGRRRHRERGPRLPRRAALSGPGAKARDRGSPPDGRKRLTPGASIPIFSGPPPLAESPAAGHGREHMTKAQLKKFRDLLEAKRSEIIRRAQQTLDEDMTLD